jgi:3-oxoacyl-[acyl-carrier protein] reductase
MQRFQGQVAIVTGGARGLGFSIAKKLGSEGVKVAIVDKDDSLAKHGEKDLITAGINATSIHGDIAEERDVERIVKQVAEKWGRIDILINNAGIIDQAGYIWELGVDVLDRVYRTNLRGTFLCCQKIVPYMQKQNYGRIVNVSSIAGKEGNPMMIPYSCTKAAIIGFTKSLGKELANTNITVNAITPAVVRTDILDQCSHEQVQYMLSKIPMGRFCTLEEVANMVAWMASEECSFTTGAVFDLSGGRATY